MREIAVVVGAAGEIGSVITAQLIEAGLDVVAVGRDAVKLSDLSQHFSDHLILCDTDRRRPEHSGDIQLYRPAGRCRRSGRWRAGGGRSPHRSEGRDRSRSRSSTARTSHHRQHSDEDIWFLVRDASYLYVDILYPEQTPRPVGRARAFASMTERQHWATAGELASMIDRPAPYFICLALIGRPKEQLQALLAGITDLFEKHLQCARAENPRTHHYDQPRHVEHRWNAGGRSARLEVDQRRTRTLFLDEVGDLPLAAQVKLLRVLQTGEVERLGGGSTQRVDVRIMAATNVDLTTAVETKKFRKDLFYPLNPFPVEIPPLRDCAADIPFFVDILIERLARRHRKPVRGVSDQAMQALMGYDWPSNVRELENVLERAVLLAELGGRIDLDTLSISLAPDRAEHAVVKPDGHLKLSRSALIPGLESATLILADYESALIAEALRRAGNVADAARLLGITRRQLDYRLKQSAV